MGWAIESSFSFSPAIVQRPERLRQSLSFWFHAWLDWKDPPSRYRKRGGKLCVKRNPIHKFRSRIFPPSLKRGTEEKGYEEPDSGVKHLVAGARGSDSGDGIPGVRICLKQLLWIVRVKKKELIPVSISGAMPLTFYLSSGKGTGSNSCIRLGIFTQRPEKHMQWRVKVH